MIEESVRFLTEHGKKVIFDAEHFFDGYKADPAYALSALESAAAGGACILSLCDTNGGLFPDEAETIVRVVAEKFPSLVVGIHCHNDGGLAVAETVAAVKQQEQAEKGQKRSQKRRHDRDER